MAAVDQLLAADSRLLPGEASYVSWKMLCLLLLMGGMLCAFCCWTDLMCRQ